MNHIRNVSLRHNTICIWSDSVSELKNDTSLFIVLHNTTELSYLISRTEAALELIVSEVKWEAHRVPNVLLDVVNLLYRRSLLFALFWIASSKDEVLQTIVRTSWSAIRSWKTLTAIRCSCKFSHILSVWPNIAVKNIVLWRTVVSTAIALVAVWYCVIFTIKVVRCSLSLKPVRSALSSYAVCIYRITICIIECGVLENIGVQIIRRHRIILIFRFIDIISFIELHFSHFSLSLVRIIGYSRVIKFTFCRAINWSGSCFIIVCFFNFTIPICDLCKFSLIIICWIISFYIWKEIISFTVSCRNLGSILIIVIRRELNLVCYHIRVVPFLVSIICFGWVIFCYFFIDGHLTIFIIYRFWELNRCNRFVGDWNVILPVIVVWLKIISKSIYKIIDLLIATIVSNIIFLLCVKCRCCYWVHSVT